MRFDVVVRRRRGWFLGKSTEKQCNVIRVAGNVDRARGHRTKSLLSQTSLRGVVSTKVRIDELIEGDSRPSWWTSLKRD